MLYRNPTLSQKQTNRSVKKPGTSGRSAGVGEPPRLTDPVPRQVDRSLQPPASIYCCGMQPWTCGKSLLKSVLTACENTVTVITLGPTHSSAGPQS